MKSTNLRAVHLKVFEKLQKEIYYKVSFQGASELPKVKLWLSKLFHEIDIFLKSLFHFVILMPLEIKLCTMPDLKDLIRG